jgi:hypothetical protein
VLPFADSQMKPFGKSGSPFPTAISRSPNLAMPVTDARTRRATLGAADRTLGTRPLVLSHAPDAGIRPAGETTAIGVSPVSRTDGGWLV